MPTANCCLSHSISKILQLQTIIGSFILLLFICTLTLSVRSFRKQSLDTLDFQISLAEDNVS